MNRLSVVGMYDGVQYNIIFVGKFYEVKTSLEDGKVNIKLVAEKTYEYYGLDLSNDLDIQKFDPESEVIADKYLDTILIKLPMDFISGVYDRTEI